MPLQGNLRDFGVAEILQLLASQEKTGILRMNGDAGRIALVFDTGQIVSARDPHLSTRDPFREFLIRRELVPHGELPRVLKAEVTSPHSFAELLLRMRVVEHEEIQTAFADHIEEKIEEILGWARGTFEFVAQDSVAPYAPGVAVKTEGLLMEAARRADEASAGAAKADAPIGEAAVAPRRAGSVAVFAHATLLAAIVFAALSGYQWFAPRPRSDPPTRPAEVLLARFESIRRDRELVALRCALDFFRYVHGRYPSVLEDLASDGLLGRDGLRAAHATGLLYTPLDGGTRYQLQARDDAEIVRRPKASP